MTFEPMTAWPTDAPGCMGAGEARRQIEPIERLGIAAATARALENLVVRDNLEILRRVPDFGARFLDFGCGNGLYERILFETGLLQPTTEYVGADVNPMMMAWCARAYGRRFEVTTLSGRSPFGESEFDTVLASGVLQLVKDWHGLLAEFARVTARGGQVVLTRVPVVLHSPTSLFRLTVRHGRDVDVHAFRIHSLSELRSGLPQFGFTIHDHEATSEVFAVPGISEQVVCRAFVLKRM